MRIRRGTTIALVLLVTAACASAHSYPIADAPTYDPVPADSVEVYESPDELPCRDVERLAELESSGDWMVGDDKLVGKMREQAARHGANAIVLAGFSESGFGGAFKAGKKDRARGVAVRLRCGGADPGG